MPEDPGPLSDREIEVLKLVATGATNQQIARALSISPNTVKVHLRNIFEKLGVQSRTEATMEAVRRGWVEVASGEVAAAQMPDGVTADLPLTAVNAPRALRPSITLWQRIYLIAAALLVLAAVLLPGWWKGRGRADSTSPLTDAGSPAAPANSPLAITRWEGGATLPVPRSRLALVSDGSKLYAIGGETAEGVTDEVTVYDPASNGWLPGPSKPISVSNIGGVWLDGRIYIPGGTTSSGAETDVFEAFDPQSGTWESRARLPSPVAAYGAAALDGKLYLFGGWDGGSSRSATLIYDPDSDSWTVGTAMPGARAFLGAAPLRNLVYVVGGYDGENELRTVLAYDPASEGTPGGPWSARADLSQPRGGLGAAALGSRIYAVGGGWNAPMAYNEQYDVQTGAWSRIGTPLPGQWRNLGLAAQGQRIYAVGGWSGSYLAVNEQYLALLRQLLPLSGRGG